MSPSERCIWVLLAWLALAVAAAFFPSLLSSWAGAGLIVGTLLAIDGVAICGACTLPVERSVAHSVAVANWSPVELLVRNPGPRHVMIELIDHVPSSFRTQMAIGRLEIPAGGSARLQYRIYPTARGPQKFDRLDLLLHSPLGFWRRRFCATEPQSIRVYPDLRTVMGYTLLATSHRTSQLGIKKRPRRGHGLDFHQLREFREGDSMRQIDWRATSRFRKLTSREYQDERDQQVVFVLDCGRKMHARDGALAHFDHALEAVLLLSHVALRQGDSVGLLTFGGDERWLAPRKGAAHLTSLLETLYDLRSRTRASDYLAALQEIAKRIHKRALIVLISNLGDEEGDDVARGLKLLMRRHLVLVASMQEQILNQVVREPVIDLESALRVASTRLYLKQRRTVHQRLHRSGVLCLDVEPCQLPVALVNGYLDIKRRGVL